jgi:hypothetical protein
MSGINRRKFVAALGNMAALGAAGGRGIAHEIICLSSSRVEG